MALCGRAAGQERAARRAQLVSGASLTLTGLAPFSRPGITPGVVYCSGEVRQAGAGAVSGFFLCYQANGHHLLLASQGQAGPAAPAAAARAPLCPALRAPPQSAPPPTCRPLHRPQHTPEPHKHLELHVLAGVDDVGELQRQLLACGQGHEAGQGAGTSVVRPPSALAGGA